MSGIPMQRRFALCAVALFVSAVVLHSQLSSAIVTSGDDQAARGQIDHALSLYRRALLFDRDNGVAADRFAFWSLLGHRTAVMQRGVIMSSAYLRRDPNDAAVLMDRGLLEASLARFDEAERDFTRAATLNRGAATYTFAGFAALRAGHRTRAIALWRRAQSLDPNYLPPRTAIAKVLR